MIETGPRVFEVEKGNLHHTRTHHMAERALKDGEVRILIDAFALTSNNITYAVFGEAMKYWSFFPTEDEAWGRVPVWGFGTVNESLNEDIDPGERYFGYFPMGTELIVQADNVRGHGFDDVSPHRAGLATVYNQYTRVSADPAYRADYEAQQMLFRPLFLTSFLIDDQLAEADFHGASQVILSSASSKTAMALAYLLKKRGVKVIALTSQRSRAFCRSSRVYDDIVLYDEAKDGLPEAASVFVDFAGNAAVRRAVHEKLKDGLKASVMVGATDWKSTQDSPDADPLPGPAPAFFFAPDRGAKRVDDWGGEEFSRRVSEALLDFYEPASQWIKPVRGIGDEAIVECYQRVLNDEALPSEGFILSYVL